MGVWVDLRAYYDEEARQETRRELTGRRLDVRNKFVELLARESRQSVVDFGAGPGRDVAGFIEAGHSCVGVDLAPENARLAAERGLDVIAASITNPPLAPASFDAGWSMSTIMHVPDADMSHAIAAMTAVLKPGAPFLIGLWGGGLGEHVDDERLPGHRRLFCLRSAEQNRAFFESVATIEHHEVWPVDPQGWDYQVFRLRMP